MTRKQTVYEPKNARAISILKTWLREVGISYRVSVTPTCDLLVTTQDGKRVEVQVNAGESAAPPEGAVVLHGAVLTGRRIQDALDHFLAFQVALGYPGTTPVHRGELPEKKLSYIDNFEDVAMRHTEFRRSTNPTTEELAKYTAVIKKAAWNFLRLNQELCHDHVLGIEDLFSYTQIWLTIYLTYYQVPVEQALDANNEKKLYSYLTQRFSEFKHLLWKKARNILPNLDVASVGRGASVPVGWETETQVGQGGQRDSAKSFVAKNVDESEEIDEAYVERHCELDLRTPNTRRTSATAKLEESLAALPHDRMMELLQEAMENTRLHADAQKEARKRLARHMHTCALCAHLSPPGLENDEDDSSPGLEEQEHTA